MPWMLNKDTCGVDIQPCKLLFQAVYRDSGHQPQGVRQENSEPFGIAYVSQRTGSAGCSEGVGPLYVHCRNFIAPSPFCGVSYANADGQAGASAGGNPPGFVQMLDERTMLRRPYNGDQRAAIRTEMPDRSSAYGSPRLPGQLPGSSSPAAYPKLSGYTAQE